MGNHLEERKKEKITRNAKITLTLTTRLHFFSFVETGSGIDDRIF